MANELTHLPAEAKLSKKERRAVEKQLKQQLAEQQIRDKKIRTWGLAALGTVGVAAAIAGALHQEPKPAPTPKANHPGVIETPRMQPTNAELLTTNQLRRRNAAEHGISFSPVERDRWNALSEKEFAQTTFSSPAEAQQAAFERQVAVLSVMHVSEIPEFRHAAEVLANPDTVWITPVGIEDMFRPAPGIPLLTHSDLSHKETGPAINTSIYAPQTLLFPDPKYAPFLTADMLTFESATVEKILAVGDKDPDRTGTAVEGYKRQTAAYIDFSIRTNNRYSEATILEDHATMLMRIDLSPIPSAAKDTKWRNYIAGQIPSR